MKKILVVIDMQNDFTTGPLGNAECKAVIPRVVDVIGKENYSEIILSKDTHDEGYLATQEGKRLPVLHCIEGTEGWKIVKEVTDAVKQSKCHYQIVCKPAFGSIELGKKIKEAVGGQEAEIYFCGVCTGICVISNAMITKAFLPETRVCVIGNACACVTPDSHQTALEAMKTCQIDII